MKKKDREFAEALRSCVMTTPRLLDEMPILQCPITPAKPTNGDRIRSMSDEDLENFLLRVEMHGWSKGANDDLKDELIYSLEWLKQEAST